MKKLLAMLLVLVLSLSLVACGDKPADSKAPESGNAPASTPVEGDKTDAELEPVELSIWFHGSNVQKDASDKVMAELNKYLAEKINVTLVPTWGTWGDFDESASLALQGGNATDIVFTCNWSGDEYNKFARDGYWVKLDDMLDEYAPELKATIPQSIWDCAKTNGVDGMGIYAVPGLKDTATQNCWDVNVTLLKELGFELPEKLDYYSADFEAMLQKAKDVKGANFFPLLIEPAVLERMVNHSSIVTGDLPGNVLSYYYDAANPSKDLGNTIVNKYASEEFKKFAEKTYDYAQKGFISPSCQSVETANDYRTATQNAGEYLFGTQSYAFGCELDFSAARGIEVAMVPETAPYMDATSGQGAMMAINAASENPERALMFLNLLNTDPVVMNMVNYGVEGYTYNTNDDGTITFTDDRANYTPWTNGVGNVRILTPTEAQGLDFWDRFSAYYDAAEALPCGGFVFDRSAFDTEAGAVGAVHAKYAFQLMSGAVDPATELPKFLEELETAGVETIVSAAQEQLAAYMG